MPYKEQASSSNSLKKQTSIDVEEVKKKANFQNGISEAGIKPLAAIMYAAAANQDQRMMQYVGSTVLNRLSSGRKEFGAENGSIMEVINHKNGYYERTSPLYNDFMSGNFKDEKSRKMANLAMSTAAALARGTLDTMPGHFWFNKQEIAKLRRNPKAFDFKKVKSLGNIGIDNQFEMFSY